MITCFLKKDTLQIYLALFKTKNNPRQAEHFLKKNFVNIKIYEKMKRTKISDKPVRNCLVTLEIFCFALREVSLVM